MIQKKLVRKLKIDTFRFERKGVLSGLLAYSATIGTAGMAFKDQPDVLKLFTDLIPGNGKKKAKPAAEPPKA